MTCDVTPILEITHPHCEAQNKLTREPIYQSETGRVADINPVMEIESLKRTEGAQILQTFKATIAPVDLQPLELQQEVKVEIVKMSSETEEEKEKAVEVREFKGGVNREKPLDGTKHSEEIVKTQKDQTDMETFNKESTEDGEGMGKRSVIENIVEDTEEIEVVKVQAGALKEKEQHECFSVQCETEDQEPSHDNKEEKVSVLIQQEENLNIAYGSGSKGKQGDERRSWHSRRLEDKAAKGEQTERVLRSSSKKTFIATSKQVDYETTEKGLNQAALTEKEQVEEIAENENVRGKIKSTGIMCIASNDNKEEINIEKDYLDHQTTDDQNILEVGNKREDSSKDENKMDEKLRDEEQVGIIEVAMTSEDGEEIRIVDVSSTDKSEKSGKASEPSAAEHIEEQEEEPALERVPAEDDVNTQVTLKQQRVALTLGAPTEKQQVVEMADHENVDIFRDRIKNRTIEVVRLDKAKIKETIDTNKMEEAEEEEPMNKPETIQSVEPKITNIEASLDYEVDQTNKDDKETAVFGVHGADNVNAAGIEVKGKVPEPSFAEPFKEQEEEPISEMVPAEIALKIKVDSKLRNEEEKTVVIVHDAEDIRGVEIRVEGSPEPSAAELVACEKQWEEPVSEAAEDDNTEEDTSLLKLQNFAVVLVDYNKVPLKQSPSESEDSKMDKEPSQRQEEEVEELHKPESIDHRNEGKEGVNQTECEAVTEDKHEETETDKLRDEKMDIEENMSEVEDKLSESDEKKMSEAQEEEVMQPLCTDQDILGEEPIIQDDVGSGEDDEGLKLDAEEEEDKTTFVTPLRWSKRHKHQLAESELTKSVLRSTANAIKQPVDDPEVEQMKEVLESHTVDVTSETGHFKAVEVGFKDKIAEQSSAETVNEHLEESSAITGPAGDDNTKEAMSGLRLEKVTVELVDEISTTPIDAGEVLETSQFQEKVDLELHKPESTDTESQTEHTDNEQVVKMRENEMKETGEKVESQEGAVLNRGNDAPESAVTDKQNTEEVQNDTLTAQEIQAEEPRSLNVIESSEEDEGERPDVIITLGTDEDDEASSLTPLRRSRRLQDQAAEGALTKRVLRRSARLTNKSSPQQRHKQQIKAMMMTEPKQLDEYKSDEMNILVESEVAVGEHMESERVNVFAEVDPGSMISAVQNISEEKSKKEKEDDYDHMNVKNVSILHGNEVEKNISSEDTEKGKMPPKEIIHGEAEQICTSGEKSPVDMELSEAVKEVEVKEKARGEDENVMEATSALALQETSVVLVDVSKIPLDHVDLHNKDVVKDNISVEEQKEELAMDVAAEEDRDNGVNSTSSLKLHKAAAVLLDFQIQTGVNETERNEVTQLQEAALPTRANQEKIVVEIGVKEPVTEREEKEEEAVGRVTDHRLIRNDEQNRNVVAEEGVSDYLKEGADILIEKSASIELDINKTVNEYQQSTTASQGENVQESTRDEDIPVCTANNPRRRTLPVKPTPERKSRHLQNTYEETKVNENTEEDSSDEEVESVLTKYLRRRTVTVTPRRRSKPLTGKHVVESVVEAHESKVYDIVEVQGTKEARNVVEETHETNSKCDSEEVSAVSKAATKDQQQDKNIPGSKAGKVEERTDKGGKMVKEAADRKDQDYVEAHLQDENEEIKDTDELNREQVGSANTKQVLDESEDGVGVERKALRKRTITSQTASVQKSKRLRKQDQGDIDVQRANTEESALVEATVKDMADLQSQSEKETTDQEKETLGREMCHKKKNQENAEGEETSGNANNSQENTVIEGMSKQVWLSEMLHVSDEDTDIKLVAQEKAKGKEDRKKELVTEEITEFENNAGEPDKVADEPKEFKDTQEYKDTQEEAEQSEKNAEGMTKANVTMDEYFTLGLDDEISSDDAECEQVVGETKGILRSRKSVTDSTERKRRSRRRQQDGPMEPSETEDKSKAEEVKQVIEGEEKKLQQKRKVGNVDEELTPRRSKRLARAKMM